MFVSAFSGMWPLFVVFFQPVINIGLQRLRRILGLLE
jgi:hypothetical protein